MIKTPTFFEKKCLNLAQFTDFTLLKRKKNGTLCTEFEDNTMLCVNQTQK